MLCASAALGGLVSHTDAQTLSGSAELTVTRSATTSATQSSDNASLGQNYTLGWSSPLLDPRLARVNAEVLLRHNTLTAHSTRQDEQRGRQHDVGFHVGSALFSSGTFPVVFEAARTRSNAAGDLAPTNPIKGAAFIPTGTLPLDFDTETRLLNVNARVNNVRLPKVELAYHRGGSVVTGGPYQSEQKDGSLSASVGKEGPRVRQSLRYQQSSFDSQFPQAFSHRLDTLDYDLSVLLGGHLRLMVQGGERLTHLRSALANPVEDAAAAPYTPPPGTGASGTRYGSLGLSYEPSARFAVRAYGTYDRQTAAANGTDSLLGTLSAHYTVIRGLTVQASGIAGDRGQMLGGTQVRVTNRSGTAGVTYRAGARWLEGSVSVVRGLGLNTSVDGLQGRTSSLTREASLSSTLGWFGVGTGYERVSNIDDILSLGNYESERLRAFVQTQASRLSLSLNGDRLYISRGSLDTLATNLQQTFSGSAAYRVWRQNQITATAGGFSNTYWRTFGSGRDDTLFWGLGTLMNPWRSLHLSAWVRSEMALASSNALEQYGLGGIGRVEYRLRTLNLALEYRHNRSHIQYGIADPDTYQGRQIRFSVVRRFDVRG